jgi:hypothetical protein
MNIANRCCSVARETGTHCRQPGKAEGLIGAVTFLVQRGALNQQQANSLLAKLQAAERSMNASRTGPACNQMGAFINQVALLMEAGALTPTLGQALANEANALKAALGCPRPHL